MKLCKNCVVQRLSNLTHFNMQNLSSNEIFSEVISKKFWLLYYSFPWAGNSPNLSAFAYWVHRKRKYIDEALLPCPNFIAKEGESLDLDRWLIEQSENIGENIFGDGAGTIIVCIKGEVVDSIGMVVDSGLLDFSNRISKHL